jgi:hypothetical protein
MQDPGTPAQIIRLAYQSPRRWLHGQNGQNANGDQKYGNNYLNEADTPTIGY